MNIEVIKKWFHRSPFKRERFFSYFLVATAVLIVTNFLYLIFNSKSTHTAYSLRYNYLYGIVKTGDWTDLYLLPIVALIVILINIFFSYFFYKKDRLISYVFLSVNIFFSIIILLETIALVGKSI